MAAADLNCAFVYALKSIGKPGLELHKEQEEALSSVYKGQDIFVWLPTSPFVMNACLFYMISS